MIFQSALLEAGIANAEKFVVCFSLLLCFREDEHYYFFFPFYLFYNCTTTALAPRQLLPESEVRSRLTEEI